LEQKVKPLGKVVQSKKLNTRDVPEVTTVTTQTVLNPYSKKMEQATVTTTTAITTSGTVKAYRPEKK